MEPVVEKSQYTLRGISAVLGIHHRQGNYIGEEIPYWSK